MIQASFQGVASPASGLSPDTTRAAGAPLYSRLQSDVDMAEEAELARLETGAASSVDDDRTDSLDVSEDCLEDESDGDQAWARIDEGLRALHALLTVHSDVQGGDLWHEVSDSTSGTVREGMELGDVGVIAGRIGQGGGGSWAEADVEGLLRAAVRWHARDGLEVQSLTLPGGSFTYVCFTEERRGWLLRGRL